MFHGFSPETMDFLWGIRMNNERDWFLAHKHEYTQYLYEPMKALGNEVFQPFQEVPGLELKVSRIYRDARMHPATPYKESLWFCIRRHVEIWGQHPALFFELRPEGASYGFLLWQPRPDAMERFRRDLAARPDCFPALLKKAQADSGLRLTAAQYRRPKPCPDPELVPYYNWKSDLEAVAEVPAGPALFSPDLAGEVRDALEAWLPVSTYFDQLTSV